MFIKKFALAAAIALSATSMAQAAPIVGSGAVAIFGVSGSPIGTIGQGTTFSFTFSLGSSGLNDLSGIGGTLVATASMTATVGTAVSFNAAWGSFAGTVDVGGVTASGPVTSRTVSITASGTFTPLSGPPDLSAFDPGPMELTFSATQTCNTATSPCSISGNYTIASNAPSNVPEPGSLALAGLALLAAGGLSRRKQSA